MKNYSTYKPSKIDWMGEIPSNWNVIPFKRLTQIKRGASPRPIDDPKYFDENGEYGWVRIADVTASERYLQHTTQKLSELGASLSVKRYPGDLFLSIAGTVGKPIISKIKCCIHDGFVWFPDLKIDPEFLYYIFSAGLAYQGLGKMGTQLNLNTDTVGYINLPLPSREEIRQIVKYLDEATEKIDSLVSIKQKLIDLLKEERTSIINQAVTKGIDPNVEMKDSGVEWLGNIPKHWKVVLFRRLVESIKDGTHGTFERVINGHPLLSAKNVFDDGIKITSNESKITEKDFHDITKNGYPQKGDILLTIVGTIGRSFVYDKEYALAFQRSVAFIRLKENLNPHFYKYYLESYQFINQLLSSAKTSAQSGVYMGDIIGTLSLVVPQKEQDKIVSFINNKTSQINLNISKIQKEIELLQEYRTSLISEVVTGKIDVRDEVASWT